jgi:hypothetical protein
MCRHPFHRLADLEPPTGLRWRVSPFLVALDVADLEAPPMQARKKAVFMNYHPAAIAQFSRKNTFSNH